MAKRLVKVAKELNVGTGTIVDHLTNNGFDIENKPTAKVTDAMYDELLKEFQRSIAIKEQADQLVIGTRPSSPSRKEENATPPPPTATSPVPPPPTSTPPIQEEKIEKVVAPPPAPTPPPAPVVEEVVAKKVEEKVEEPVKEEAEKEKEDKNKARGLKILGKINLDNKRKAPVTPPKPEPQEEEIEEEEEIEIAEVKEVVVNTPPVPPAKETPKPIKEEKAPTPPKKEEVPTSKQTPAPKTQTPAKQEKIVQKDEKTVAKKPQQHKPPVKNKQDAPKKTEAPKKGHQKPKQEREERHDKKKTPVQKKKGAEPVSDNKAVQKPSGEKEKPEAEAAKPKSNLLRAKTPELRGLKILGKINIEKKPKKSKDKNKANNTKNKPGEQNKTGNKPGGTDDPNKKRRRKRKKVPNSNNNNSNNNNNNNNNNTPQRQGQSSGGGQNRDNRGGNNNRGRNNNNRGRNQRGNNRRDEPREVSQKQIDEKIKATMARLQGGNKKKRQRLRREHRENVREKQELREMKNEPTGLQLTEFVTVSELASLMDVSVTQVITTCMNFGVIVSINQRLDAEVIELVADEFGHKVEFISAEEQADEDEEVVDDPADLSPRSPIVTVMGHVDHGKTSLLDYIREANVASGEAGGITQHIGAYEVVVGEDKKKITFLDTPGHEAFTAMRARGAKVTDVAVIIISADDNIMPQTKEAISHAQAAGVPIVFAINKIDKDGAQPERIKQELASMNLLVEEWGGQYQSQDISAKMGTNIDLLLEKILLEAEVLELQANPDREAHGTLLEASLDKGRGYVTKILVQTGTLRIGDPVVCGEYSGKVKAMFNERGKKVKEAGPSTPVLVLGLSGAPQAGEKFKVLENEQEARQIAAKRAQIAREQSNRANKRISLDEIGRRLALGNFKELNLIVKGDVDGSIEALSDSLIKQSIETVQVNVIHKAVGQIIESDVLLASASDAIIIGFQVRPSLGARKLAEREGVQVKTYSIIYEAIEEIRSAIEGMLEPTKEEKILGQVEVREVYKISRVGTIAGCLVQEGKIMRNNYIRVIRNGIVVFPLKENVKGEISSLKRFKDDVKEVKNNMECGLAVKNFNDIKVGDVIEAYEIVEVKQTLDGKKKAK